MNTPSQSPRQNKLLLLLLAPLFLVGVYILYVTDNLFLDFSFSRANLNPSETGEVQVKEDIKIGGALAPPTDCSTEVVRDYYRNACKAYVDGQSRINQSIEALEKGDTEMADYYQSKSMEDFNIQGHYIGLLAKCGYKESDLNNTFTGFDDCNDDPIKWAPERPI